MINHYIANNISTRDVTCIATEQEHATMFGKDL